MSDEPNNDYSAARRSSAASPSHGVAAASATSSVPPPSSGAKTAPATDDIDDEWSALADEKPNVSAPATSSSSAIAPSTPIEPPGAPIQPPGAPIQPPGAPIQAPSAPIQAPSSPATSSRSRTPDPPPAAHTVRVSTRPQAPEAYAARTRDSANRTLIGIAAPVVPQLALSKQETPVPASAPAQAQPSAEAPTLAHVTVQRDQASIETLPPIPPDSPTSERSASPAQSKSPASLAQKAPAASEPAAHGIVEPSESRARDPAPPKRSLALPIVVALALGAVVWFGLRAKTNDTPVPPADYPAVESRARAEQGRLAPPAAPAPGEAVMPPGSQSALPSTASESTSGSIVINVRARPPGARFYRKGKHVGTTTMTVELKPGEKRAFEVGLDGYVTRRLVVDGSKPELVVGLNPVQ